MADTKLTRLDEILPPGIWLHFDFSRYYEDEQVILKPALELKGYTNIRFRMGERDSFGPLFRIVETDQGRLWYG